MLKIGTSGNHLALWQAKFTQAELAKNGIESELVMIKTAVESAPHHSAAQPDRGGHFAKAMEDALLSGEIDMAVHTLKNLPTHQSPGLAITAVSHRYNPADCLIIRKDFYQADALLKIAPQVIVGVSSHLRKAQMASYRPDLQLKDAPDAEFARLEKLRSGDFDAILLAAAYIEQLQPDLTGFEVMPLPPRDFIPAPSQGVIAWQTNREDTGIRLIMRHLHHPEVSACTNVERRVLQLMDADHPIPLGVYCERDASGNYHAFAALEVSGVLRRTRLSSSTRFGMAEKIVSGLRGG